MFLGGSIICAEVWFAFCLLPALLVMSEFMAVALGRLSVAGYVTVKVLQEFTDCLPCMVVLVKSQQC